MTTHSPSLKGFPPYLLNDASTKASALLMASAGTVWHKRNPACLGKMLCWQITWFVIVLLKSSMNLVLVVFGQIVPLPWNDSHQVLLPLQILSIRWDKGQQFTVLWVFKNVSSWFIFSSLNRPKSGLFREEKINQLSPKSGWDSESLLPFMSAWETGCILLLWSFAACVHTGNEMAAGVRWE